MRYVTVVDPEWLAEMGPMFFSIKVSWVGGGGGWVGGKSAMCSVREWVQRVLSGLSSKSVLRGGRKRIKREKGNGGRNGESHEGNREAEAA